MLSSMLIFWCSNNILLFLITSITLKINSKIHPIIFFWINQEHLDIMEQISDPNYVDIIFNPILFLYFINILINLLFKFIKCLIYLVHDMDQIQWCTSGLPETWFVEWHQEWLLCHIIPLLSKLNCTFGL
jgi:hypothetical protein